VRLGVFQLRATKREYKLAQKDSN